MNRGWTLPAVLVWDAISWTVIVVSVRRWVREEPDLATVIQLKMKGLSHV